MSQPKRSADEGIISFSKQHQYYSLFSSTQEVTWQEFERNMLQKKAVKKIVVVSKEISRIYIKEEFINDSAFSEVLKSPVGEGISPGPHYFFNIGSIEC